MIITKVTFPKNWNLKIVENLIQKYAKQYLKSYIKNFRKNRLEQTKLQTIESYLKSYININNVTLYNIISYIINNICLNNNILYIKENVIYKKKIENLYKLITYGNLQFKGNSVIDDAIKYSIKRVRIKLQYGY